MSRRAREESARRVSDCVTALLQDQPFFGSLALRLPISADASRETLASDGREALNLAKAQGLAPGAVEEAIRDAHRNTLDWPSLLRRYMTDAAPRDYSWTVPNRRFIDSGLYLPSMRTEGIGTLAVIIDTSGSVDTDVLAAFWSEVREVAAEIKPERVLVLQVDTAVQDEIDYAAGELPERITVKGRWGTDFRPGFARLAERGERPACCLYFTDMDCDRYPESEPDFSVLWVDWSTGPCSSMQPPPWGEHIRIVP